MPPKRAAPASSGAAPKKPRSDAKGSNSDSSDNEQFPRPPRSKRWAKVSGSGNLDDSYRFNTRNPAKAYKYVCLCRAPFEGEDDEEESDGWDDVEEDEDEEVEDEDEVVEEVEESANPPKNQCDGGRTCICNKLVEEHPDHPWKITVAAKSKFFDQISHCGLRDPDNFQMYTYNDHAGYGTIEAIENLILDFDEAKDNLDEKWAICETLGYFIQTDRASMMFRVDDPDRAEELCVMLVRLFMSMLARLERENLLGPDSRIKNLGTIMGLWMLAAKVFRGYDFLEADDEEEPLGPKKDKKNWLPSSFDNLILAYARKYNITLSGPSKIANLIEECEEDTPTEDVDLPVPESNNGPKADPFGFASNLKMYKSDHGSPKIGGDRFDITTFSSAERRDAAFDGRDPLNKSERARLKQGMVLMV
ncbi:uncharacterized protein DFL_008819 [Arthrobotrys flagrans]|uniref:Uncharacterized protein n=1 Tax=Arthrobotrys flagrans TaxID=97331 RepID=A0A436ZPX4_ARTFL|nr:hypothetical protein DFL_008819 [Arthrobotrys flagrans]